MTTPAQLSQALNRNAEQVCKHLLPNGKRIGHEWCAGDAYGGEGRSLKIVIEGDKAGVGSDFATGEVFGDLLDLWCTTQSVGLSEAMAQACSYLGIVNDGQDSRPKKEYKRPPKPKSVQRLNKEGKVYQYLKSRGFTDQCLEDFRISEEQGQWIVFPYLREGQFINAKYLHIERTAEGKKQCRQEKDAEPCLFGWDALELRYPTTRFVVLTEGECFTGSCEVLTDQGWTRFDQYQSGRVAQWQTDGSIQFVYPLARVEKDYSGVLIEYSGRAFYSLTTPKHSLIAQDQHGRYYKHWAVDGPRSVAHHIPRCGLIDGAGIDLTDAQIKLCIAISADAAIDVRKQSYAGGQARSLALCNRYVRFGLKRERKIDRLRTLLTECCITASDTKIANGYQSICFGIDDWVPGRFLPFSWIEEASLRQRELILSELVHWDGNSVPNRTMTEYATKYQENADFVQALAHSTGRCSSIVKRKNEFGEWLKVTILNEKKDSSWQTVKRASIHHDGKVYCVQVPSGAIIVRQKGQVMVSGNCDAMTYHQCGLPALSIPNGGGGGKKQDWIDQDYDRLSRFDTIYLSMDNDGPGKEAEKEIITRLGSERIRVIQLPYKDANECFAKGIKTFHRYLLSAKCLDPAELKPADYFTDDVLDKFFPKPGSYQGMKTPWQSVTNALTFQREELIVWTGYSGSGKSTTLNQVAVEGMSSSNEKFCICSLEMPSKVTLYRMVRQITGEARPDEATIRRAMQWLSDKCWMVHILGTIKTQRILDVFKYAVKRYDIRNFICDSLTKVGIREDDYDGQKSFVDQLCDFNHQYESTTHLVVHQRKPESEANRPCKFGVRGAAAITDEASSVISIWRRPDPSEDEPTPNYGRKKKVEAPTDDHPPDTILSIVKNRETGVEGKFGLWFENSSLQYHERKFPVSKSYLDRRSDVETF